MNTYQFLKNGFKGNNSVGRYLLMIIVVIIGGSLIGNLPMIFVSNAIATKNGYEVGHINLIDFESYGMNSNLGLLLMILPFAITLLLFAVLIRPIHKRSFKETITGKSSFRWKRVGFAMLVWGIISLVTTGLDILLDPDNYTFQFNASQFILLLVVVLCFLPFQTTFEEVIFRGYLTQLTGMLSKNKWVAILVPSALFAAMHLANPEVKEYGVALTMPIYFGLGFLMALVTILDDGLELAIGIHAANNMFAALFVTSKASAFQTHALFEQSVLEFTVTQVIVTYVFLTIAFLIFAKKYQFNYSILKEKVRQ